MKFHTKGWAVMAAVALVASAASTALAIESFQERFEWGDMSKPTTLQGRVIVLDPYDEAVWINVAVFGGNAESGLFWQKIHPGKDPEVLRRQGCMGRAQEDGPSSCGTGCRKGSAAFQHDRLDRVCRDRARAESSCHFLGQEASGSGRFHGEAAQHLRSSVEGVRGEERN